MSTIKESEELLYQAAQTSAAAAAIFDDFINGDENKVVQTSNGTVKSLLGLQKILKPKDSEEILVLPASSGDSTSFINQGFTKSKKVKLAPGLVYYVSDLSIPVNAILDCQGAVLKRSAGAKYAVILGSYHGNIVNAEVNGDAIWQSSSINASGNVGDMAITVSNASGFLVGMRVVYTSSWAEGGIETNEIRSISGNSITLKLPIKGAVVQGNKILADFPLVSSSGGSSVYGSGSSLFIRNCLFCFESGRNDSSGNNSFSCFDNFICEGYVGAALVLSPNTAAESFNVMHMNGGRTQSSTFTGDGTKTRFAVPYYIKKKVYRWGTEPSVRLLINGVQQSTSNYTVDVNTFEVVANTAPANGANVQVVNYEYSSFNVIGQAVNPSAPSSIERLGSAIAICANINFYFEGCELGFTSNVQADTAGYANTVLIKCSNFHMRAFDNLYGPFGLILDNCSACSLVGFGTSLVPDSAEHVVTPGKTELVVRDNCTNITVDYLSWNSTSGYTRSVSSKASPAEATYGRKLSLSPDHIAIGGPASGKMMIYGANGTVQVSDDGQGLYFGNAGYKYIQATASNAVMRVGSTGSGGSLELTGPSGVRVTLDGSGRVLFPSIPTSASGLPSGAIWKDTANGNVIKIV